MLEGDKDEELNVIELAELHILTITFLYKNIYHLSGYMHVK